MTEEEWLRMSTSTLIRRLPRKGKQWQRRHRLAFAGVCRLMWNELDDELRPFVISAEGIADDFDFGLHILPPNAIHAPVGQDIILT